MDRANYDTSTKFGMRHFYSYQIHSVRLVNRKSKMAAIFQDGHEQIHFTSSSRTKVAEFLNFLSKLIFWRFHKYVTSKTNYYDPNICTRYHPSYWYHKSVEWTINRRTILNLVNFVTTSPMLPYSDGSLAIQPWPSLTTLLPAPLVHSTAKCAKVGFRDSLWMFFAYTKKF